MLGLSTPPRRTEEMLKESRGGAVGVTLKNAGVTMTNAGVALKNAGVTVEQRTQSTDVPRF
jgi:hypothetical protein